MRYFSPSWADPFSLTYLSTCLKSQLHMEVNSQGRGDCTPPARRPVTLFLCIPLGWTAFSDSSWLGYPTLLALFPSVFPSIWHIFACLASWPVVLAQVMLRSSCWIFSILPGLSNGMPTPSFLQLSISGGKKFNSLPLWANPNPILCTHILNVLKSLGYRHAKESNKWEIFTNV